VVHGWWLSCGPTSGRRLSRGEAWAGGGSWLNRSRAGLSRAGGARKGPSSTGGTCGGRAWSHAWGAAGGAPGSVDLSVNWVQVLGDE
jgi:hypothetical protein